MATRILVPLKGARSLDEVAAHLTALACPAMTIVFLVRHQEAPVPWSTMQLTCMQSEIKKLPAVRAAVARASLEAQKRIAWRRLAPIATALKARGVTVAVHLYGGSLKRAIAGLRDKDSDVVLFSIEKPNIFRKLAGALKTPLNPMRSGVSSLFTLVVRKDT